MHAKLFDTEHPVAFVTGSAARRVGQHIASNLACRGYHLVIHAHHSETEGLEFVDQLAKDGCQAMLVTGSVTDESNVERWMEQIKARFGRLDVLVNSAAIWSPQPLESTTAEDVQRHWQVNTLGSFLCCQKAGLWMAGQPSGGAIVLISDWAVARPYRGFAAYFPSKGAIISLTRSMAVELADRNPRIRVNAVLPGPVLLANDTPTEIQESIKQQSLLKRHGTPEHVAQAVAFLIEHEFMTGVCLPVDGGRTIWSGDNADAIAHPDLFEHT